MTKKPKLPKSKPFILPKALTPNQGRLINSIISKDMTITIGPAGSGKSYLPAAYAAYYYYTGRIDKIILCKPTVAVGKGIGFLPGTLEEKLAPWTAPFIQILVKHLSLGEVECMIKNNKLVTIPFDTIRGHTFDDAFIVLEEAQNCTKTDIQAFLTRIGENSKTVVNGDIRQTDLREASGLAYICDLLGDIENEALAEKVGFVEFDWTDCVRSEMCRMWIKAFR